MFFTSDQLSSDPELRPITWTSPQAYQSERHYLLTQLASCFHEQVDSPKSSTFNLCGTSKLSTKSITGGTGNLAVNLPNLSNRNDSTTTINTLASRKSASTLLGSRRLASPFLPSSPSTMAFKPVVFTSPQTSVFRFDPVAKDINSPLKVDSVMGSPVKFLSPAAAIMSKRKRKLISVAGKVAGHLVEVKENDIFNYFKNVGNKEKSGEREEEEEEEEDKYQNDDGKSDKEGKKSVEDGVEEIEIVIKNDIDDKGVRYVEYLGLAVAAEPQSIEHQYRFVKAQLQKSRDMGFDVEGGQKPS